MSRFDGVMTVRDWAGAGVALCVALLAAPSWANSAASDYSPLDSASAPGGGAGFDAAFRDLFGVWRTGDEAAGRAPVVSVAAPASPQNRAYGAPAVIHISGGEWQAGTQPAYAVGAHITVSRAADALGAAVDFTRPIGLRRRTAAGAANAVAIPSGLPVAARWMTSGFGLRRHPTLGGVRMHSGVDLAAPTGAPIVAPSDGYVSLAGWNGGYGLAVALEHGGGLQTRYGHMSQLAVTAGQKVRRGDIIGYVGSTGRSTGPHLHYEMRVNGQAVNPFGSGRK